jgi:hypothetical protein
VECLFDTGGEYFSVINQVRRLFKDMKDIFKFRVVDVEFRLDVYVQQQTVLQRGIQMDARGPGEKPERAVEPPASDCKL